MSVFPFEPAPRWTILPGDPPALKNWLLAKPAEDVEHPDLPDEQDDPMWRKAS